MIELIKLVAKKLATTILAMFPSAMLCFVGAAMLGWASFSWKSFFAIWSVTYGLWWLLVKSREDANSQAFAERRITEMLSGDADAKR